MVLNTEMVVKRCKTMLVLRTISVLLNTVCLAAAIRKEIFSVFDADKVKMVSREYLQQ
jgi:hypothetical protein